MWCFMYLYPSRRNQHRFYMISDLTQPHRSLEWRWFYKSLNSKGAVFRLLNVLCDKKKNTHVALDTTGMSYFPLERVFTPRVFKENLLERNKTIMQ